MHVDLRKKSIDWEQRDFELKKLCDSRSRNGNYDCIVPGRGKDSVFTAHILKLNIT